MIPSKRAKKRPLKLRGEDSEIQYELHEMEGLLRKLHLSLLIHEDYVVFMRSGFDLTLAGEPYIAIMLLLNRLSGRFFARIWNRHSICFAKQIENNFNLNLQFYI